MPFPFTDLATIFLNSEFWLPTDTFLSVLFQFYPHLLLWLIGNVPDSEHERHVTTEAGRRKAESFSVLFIETNARNKEDVQLAMRKVAEAAIEVCVICLHPRKPKCACFTSIQISKEQVLKKINEPGNEKMCIMSYANNKGADQPAHPRSLISAFVVRC